ncbi:type II toxin-antitoxin system RelE/ParE family toxin [Haloferula chungangensis]|uniref:Type II toxin-antitoxin system RelE/ParE family toxin n=1 Tax=Haloferula chungangensis TaxID=1048331 RepID=A0ABW2LA49_9BACT
MPNFELSHLADGDIAGIIRYTIVKWDDEQAIRYVGFLDAHFEAIGKGEARTKAVFGHRGDLRVSRCQRHVIFPQERSGDHPLILAVFHESMELMERLKERLD